MAACDRRADAWRPPDGPILTLAFGSGRGRFLFLDVSKIDHWLRPKPRHGWWSPHRTGQLPAMRAKLSPDPKGASCRLLTERQNRNPTPAARCPILSRFGVKCCGTPGRSDRAPNVISTGKLRYRFAAFSGIRHGAKAIHWTTDAGSALPLPVPHTASRSRSYSPRYFSAVVRTKGGPL